MGKLAITGALAALLLGTSALAAPPSAPITDRLPEDEIIYFVLPDRFENGDPSNDRGGIEGDKNDHGFDPADKAYYQGGDLKGLTARLDYIQGLGATAIWLTPIFKNKAVQGGPGRQSAGYHGYWITDFLDVDPHLGTRADFKEFVDAAHDRGMKVYMDIITNHTADVIQYAECHGPNAPEELKSKALCPYRAKGDYPYTTRGPVEGEPINDGFLGDDPWHQTVENFEALERPDYAYTPIVAEHEKDIKNPAWLNDVRYYHNRGETSWEGENSLYGDFAGLDDLFTAHPFVVEGFIDIYKQWITDFRVDGFRIDTARHVNNEFWQQFAPAIMDHAKAEGIEHFHMFGEVYDPDPAQLAKFTTHANLPTVLDFAFQNRIQGVIVDGKPMRELEQLFDADLVYAGGRATARQLPTFLGNHDMGRFAGFVAERHPDMSQEERLSRVKLAHAMMMFSRGVPTIYYGDEQGFVSDGGDQDARETMFPSQTEVYSDNDLLGTNATVADENFDPDHPLYRAIADMAEVRLSDPALRRGHQIVRHSDLDGGLIVLSRRPEGGGGETIVAFNAETAPRSFTVGVDGRAQSWESLYGECARRAAAPGAYDLTIPALGAIVCRSEF